MYAWKNYRLIPKNIKAIQFTGDNLKEIDDLCGTKCVGASFCGHQCIKTTIETEAGWIQANIGDYIVKFEDNFRVYKEDIFKSIYEAIGHDL